MDCCARSTRSCRWKTDVSRNAKSARQTPTPSQPSPSLDAGLINSLKPTVRSAFLNIVRNEQATFLNDYLPFWLREEQVAPAGDWRNWLLLGGRGAGKTLAGASWIATNIRLRRSRRVGVIGATFNDTRAIMIEGESGLLKLCAEAKFEPSNRRITFSGGGIATVL